MESVFIFFYFKCLSLSLSLSSTSIIIITNEIQAIANDSVYLFIYLAVLYIYIACTYCPLDLFFVDNRVVDLRAICLRDYSETY